jgi:NAD(P)H-dependent FMN reductase/GNAT superfamily N-acetyltransferase
MMTTKVLALSGSLRAESINSAFCRAAARLATPPITVSVYSGLGSVPLFNADLDGDPPPSVRALRSAIEGSAALIIASPEYAHGISGVIKNALDWLVSFEGFVGKPIALVNTSPRATLAYEALGEVLRTMSANIVPEASVTVALLGAGLTEDEMVRSPMVAGKIRGVLAALARRSGGGHSPPSEPSYALVTGYASMDMKSIHDFLASSYWSPGVAFEVVDRAARNSMCFGVRCEEGQVAFARVVTDKATFAYLADVYVAQPHRGKGLARLMLDAIVRHPDLQGLRRFLLATRDAHSLYGKYGFTPIANPSRLMEIHDPHIYASARSR